MQAVITVEKIGGQDFLVQVSERDSTSTHRVTLKESDYNRLTNGKATPAALIQRSFEFLLAREPKESILARFDLNVINRYFPEYEGEIMKSF